MHSVLKKNFKRAENLQFLADLQKNELRCVEFIYPNLVTNTIFVPTFEESAQYSRWVFFCSVIFQPVNLRAVANSKFGIINVRYYAYL